MQRENVTNPEARRRKLHMVAKQIGLTRDERIELAEYILRRDITSYRQLDDSQVIRLLDALEGFELVVHLLSARQRPSSG